MYPGFIPNFSRFRQVPQENEKGPADGGALSCAAGRRDPIKSAAAPRASRRLRGDGEPGDERVQVLGGAGERLSGGGDLLGGGAGLLGGGGDLLGGGAGLLGHRGDLDDLVLGAATPAR